jgi:glycerol-3-phosphate dehydrogenase
VRAPEEGERISPDEIAYLCDAVNEYLVRNVTPDDVVWTFAGVRALHDDGDANPSRVSRDDRLILDADGAPSLSIIGGKLTTHRRVAERALQKLAPYLPAMGAPWTADAVLPGGDLGGDFENFVAALQREYAWAPAASMRRLAGAYGTRARIVLGDAVSINDLGRGFGADLYERELDYMMRHEFARTGEDALWRRSKLGLVLGEAERSAVDDWMRTA